MRGCSPYWHLRISCPLVVAALGVAAQLTDAKGGATFDGVTRDFETVTPAAATARSKAGTLTVVVMGPTP